MENNSQIKSFKCKGCGHRFYAPESLDVVACPNCKSENVSLVETNKWVTPLLMAVVFVVCSCIGFFATGEIRKSINESYVISVDSTSNSDTDIQHAPIRPVEITTSFEPVVNTNYVYSFVAHCNLDSLDSAKELIYELLPEYEEKVLMNNSDGKFTNVQPTPSGTYRFRVRVKDTNQTSEPQIVTGFNERPKIAITPMTETELEEKINQRVSSEERLKISPTVQVSYTNKREEDAFYSLQDVENQLMYGQWSAVRVISVKYSEEKIITALSLEIVYP